MGQAFNKEGSVLAEAFGDTKREVFDQLITEAPDAHEIRIKNLRESIPMFNTEQAFHVLDDRITELDHKLDVLIAATVASESLKEK